MLNLSNHKAPARRSYWWLGCLIPVFLLLLAACGGPGQSPQTGAPQTAVLLPTPTPHAADPAPETVPDAPAEQPADAPAEVPDDEPEPAEAEPVAADLPEFSPDTHTVGLETVAAVFSRPLYVTHAGDGSGRIFVVEKQGVIHIMQNGVVADQPFLDIRDRVGSSGLEQGLLGLAFAPDYAESGYFFVNYTNTTGNTVVSRFQVATADAGPIDPAQTDPAGEFIVLQIDQPAGNHNGGLLKFGPDGNLWIGTGDGGGAGDRFDQAQNPTVLLGKMLRIDVTSDPTVPYLIPADNPWTDVAWNGQEVRDEIWAIGLRNPWRYSFDRATGDLWIADVGQNAYEAVHFTPADHPGGINYGWPILEGSHCYRDPGACDPSGLDLPVLEYAHGEGDCSITGGYVYRGEEYPALQGAYLFGDYCSGNMWVATPTSDGQWISHHVLATGFQLSSFGEDEAGELYVTGLNDGTVYRIVVN